MTHELYVPYNPDYHRIAKGVTTDGGLKQKKKFISTQHSYFVDGQQIKCGIMPIHEFIVKNCKSQAEANEEFQKDGLKQKHERNKKAYPWRYED